MEHINEIPQPVDPERIRTVVVDADAVWRAATASWLADAQRANATTQLSQQKV